MRACQTKYLPMDCGHSFHCRVLVPPVHFSLSICVTKSCSMVSVSFVHHKACRANYFFLQRLMGEWHKKMPYITANISYFPLMALKLLPRCGFFSSLSPIPWEGTTSWERKEMGWWGNCPEKCVKVLKNWGDHAPPLLNLKQTRTTPASGSLTQIIQEEHDPTRRKHTLCLFSTCESHLSHTHRHVRKSESHANMVTTSEGRNNRIHLSPNTFVRDSLWSAANNVRTAWTFY